MKRFLIFSLIFCLVIGLFFVNKKVTIVSDYNYKLDDNSLSCPGSATCCESGYNVMCHMVDPIKNYHVTDTVCSNRSGVYHKGVDLTTSGDGSIYAIFDGVVVATTNNDKNCVPNPGTLTCSPITCKSSRGISVTIEVADARFAGYKVNYLHMSSKTVSVGDVVRQGDKIGVIGNTGCSTGRHLHFQVNNYNGDAVVVNSYFTDKTSYSCGGVDASTFTNNNLVDAKALLKNDNGYKYNALIGKCVGNYNGSFFPGVELRSNGSKANVYTVASGVIVDRITNNCKNGLAVLGEDGNLYTYCNLDNKNSYSVGDYLSEDTFIGTIGRYDSESGLIFSVKKFNTYLDVSNDFLLTYGGACDNSRNRKNCNRVTDAIENYACNQVFK